ncbi:MAG: hypothetical protein AVDCRST_MAG78-3728 [uncultured Rubrobacteraceae bacterium]|uniref:SCP domain-containing protein n=1 Tax=uncultured Rubrobacteraceae bacterium TaxID=349277 RepID=A0A6J4QVV1_9ACTN|nr:MAG: hypothetical protein AVDCRST_MAG78-3728 [uncultured Rubrobacteraceae bacterium]
MVLKYVATALTAAMLAAAAAVGATAAEPQRAEAADGVEVKACGGGRVDLTAEEKKMLDLHNRARADRNLSRLCVHPDLQRAARAHSKEMIDKDYYRHDSANGEEFWQRLKRFGYKNYRIVGENIHGVPKSYSTGEVFGDWMRSSGHKDNILNKGYREVGIGARTGNYKGTGNFTMWTVDFGAR